MIVCIRIRAIAHLFFLSVFSESSLLNLDLVSQIQDLDGLNVKSDFRSKSRFELLLSPKSGDAGS